MSTESVESPALKGAAPRVTAGSKIELQGVTKVYGEGPLAKKVVEDCSFFLEPGKVSVMVGPSGCGKSSIAFLIAGYERATKGKILLDGKGVGGPSWDRLVVFQESALLPWLTTYENIMFGPKARGFNKKEMGTRAETLLERVGLKDFRDKYPTQLSGGMQRRAELARALINDPKIMILDEPFRGLDHMTRGLMQEYFSGLLEENPRTSLFITTDIDEAIFLADRLIIMTCIPTKVCEVIDVDLPRPRDREELLMDQQANQIKERALELLHVEAVKAFAGGSKAAADFVDAYVKRRGQ
ncbi:MAG: ABC transporter ATP-binding protein [Acidimicrobiia bacterium]